jgi:uncharacterized protein with PQ loop repeat
MTGAPISKMVASVPQTFLQFMMVQVLGCAFVYFVLSNRSFNVLYTIGATISTLNFLRYLLDMMTQNSAQNISLKMLLLQAIAATARLVALVFDDAYIPVDTSGISTYKVIDIVNFAVMVGSVVVITTYCKDSSDTKFDGFDIRILIVL